MNSPGTRSTHKWASTMEQRPRRRRHYTSLGAPALLHREPSTSAALETPSTSLDHHEENDHLRQRRRVQSKWYYPIDHSHLRDDDDDDDDDDDVVFSDMMESQGEARKRLLKRGRLVASNSLLHDWNYVLARTHPHKKSKTIEVRKRKKEIARRLLLQRNLLGHPAYLAPCGEKSLDEARTEAPPMPKQQPNSPESFGNCLECLSCRCDQCSGKADATWWLLHPVGPLLDRVRLSLLALPYGKPLHTSVEANVVGDADFELREDPHELCVGDCILQIQACGPKGGACFVVRTSLHCTICRVEMANPIEEDNIKQESGGCLGNLQVLRQLHRIDFRSVSFLDPSFRPLDVAAHPKYGAVATDLKLAILCENEQRRERNVIKHVFAGAETRVTSHCISNLQNISAILFTRHDPMLLWAVARSWVRPNLTRHHLEKMPKLGHGHSLYTIDLRTNIATLQWSPSHAMHLPEAVHSISGIALAKKEDRLLVSSESAGKTWELDTRPPCPVVTTWSLAHSCDYDCAESLHTEKARDAGVILTEPSSTFKDDNEAPRPFFEVRKSPSAFGVHLNQRPDLEARFFTPNLEVASSPALSNMSNKKASRFADPTSLALSSIYPLSELSKDSFPCGHAAIRTKASILLSNENLSHLDALGDCPSWAIISMTLTSSGDVYAHSLLESESRNPIGSVDSSLPVGCTSIALAEASKPTSLTPKGAPRLKYHVTNIFSPPPGDVLLQHTGDLSQPFEKASPDELAAQEMTESTKQTAVLSSGTGRKQLQLPSSYQEAAREDFASTLDCFLPVPVKPPIEQPRSDLNEELLHEAEGEWDKEHLSESDVDDASYAFLTQEAKSDSDEANDAFLAQEVKSDSDEANYAFLTQEIKSEGGATGVFLSQKTNII